MAPQQDSQKDDSEINEMEMTSPPTMRRSSLRLQIEGDHNKQSRRVSFAPGTKEMSNNKTSVSTPSKKRNTWNPAHGWKIDPSVKLSFDVVDLYKGPRLGELASYANSYYQQKRSLSTTSSSIPRFQTDGMNSPVVNTCPMKRSLGSPRIQSEKLSDPDVTSSNDMDTLPLPRMNGSPRMQSEKLSDSTMDMTPLPRMQEMMNNSPQRIPSEKLSISDMNMSSLSSGRIPSEKLSDKDSLSSSSPLKHRRTCRSDLPSFDDIILLNRSTTTTMDTENQLPKDHHVNHNNNHDDIEQPKNTSLLTTMTSKQTHVDERNCFDQTMRSKTPSSSSSKCHVSQAMSTMLGINTNCGNYSTICGSNTIPLSSIPIQIESMMINLFPSPKHIHIDEDTLVWSNSANSSSLTFPGQFLQRSRPTILAIRCFICVLFCWHFVFIISNRMISVYDSLLRSFLDKLGEHW